MKIITRLILLSLAFAVVIVAIGLVTADTFSRINKEVKESHDANLMIKDVFELNIVTYQYMMHHEKRMQQQWQLKYDSFGKLLDRMGRKESHPEIQPTLAGVMSDYNALGILFSQLQANFAKRKSLIEENRPKIEINMTFTLEERLITQTLMRAQKIVSGAFEVSDTIQKRITRLQEKTNLTVLFSIIGFIVLSMCISFFTIKSITVPVSMLVKDAEIISKGNLEHEIDINAKDEIGILARAFRQMAQNLIAANIRLARKVKKRTAELEEEITERKMKEEMLRDAQEQLIRKERLAVLGQLAGGVGHELRNPLGVISNAVFYLHTILPDADETTREYLGIITSEVGNAEKIVSDLLDFSRIKSTEKEEIAVSDLVAQVLEKHPTPANVEVSTKIPYGLPSVFADAGQIGQVLINLLTNAYQDMPEGGRITVRARGKRDKVSLSITDTGYGISKENMKKIFEPLFTTKASGIGLGLAVSRNLVEANGGSIEVVSEENKGSTFTIILPTEEAAS